MVRPHPLSEPEQVPALASMVSRLEAGGAIGDGEAGQLTGIRRAFLEWRQDGCPGDWRATDQEYIALATEVLGADPDAKPEPPFTLHTIGDIRSRPPLPYIIGSRDTTPVLAKRVYSVMYGPPGHGKTFEMLNMLFCLAAGISWFGLPVEPMDVLYISDEGEDGLKERFDALCEHYDTEPEGFRIITDVMNLFDDGMGVVRDLVDTFTVDGFHPGQIAIDPLANFTVGANENDVKDFGAINATVRRIIRDTGAGVMVGHHSNKNGDMRGSTALLAAVDLQLRCTKEGDSITLACTKSKHAKEFSAMYHTLTAVGFSCVPTDGKQPTSTGWLSVLQFLDDNSIRGGATYTDMKNALCQAEGGRRPIIPALDLSKILKQLWGEDEEAPGQYIHSETLVERKKAHKKPYGDLYHLTDAGKTLLRGLQAGNVSLDDELV